MVHLTMNLALLRAVVAPTDLYSDERDADANDANSHATMDADA